MEAKQIRSLRESNMNVLMAICFTVALSPVSAAQLFSETFESYAPGSNIIGQGGWVGGPDPIIVNNVGPLPSRVLDGLAAAPAFSQEQTSHNLPGALPTSLTSVMTFDAYATSSNPRSENSWAGLSGSNGSSLANSVIWDYSTSNYGGWGLEIRQVGAPFTSYSTGAGADVAGSFSLVFDTTLSKVWGTYNLGSGIVETPHYSILPSTLSAINGVNVGFDYRGTRGIQIDNIYISSVPEPIATWHWALGMGALLFNRRLRKARAEGA